MSRNQETGKSESWSEKWHADTNPFVNASVMDSSFDSAPEETVAIDPEEYCGSTGFAESGGVDGSAAGGGDATWRGGVLTRGVSRRV